MTDWRLLSLLSIALLPATRALGADLPVPCVAGSCGAAVGGFVTSGSASAVVSGSLLRVDQQSDRAILNWSSFDVAPGHRVQFAQPGSSAIALNRIFQASPSTIRGSIDANGQIYLVNQNGLIFGPEARVSTAGIIASTLGISDANFATGLLAPDLLRDGRPALASDGRLSVLDAAGQPVVGADGRPLEVGLVVESGAQLSTRGTGGRMVLAGQEVSNAGSLSTPGGQTILAAGERVYLQASTDPALRGLLVEVDGGGRVWNQASGRISASEGNISLVGLAVNQDGRLSATTSVDANGSIRLLARDTASIVSNPQGFSLFATRNGRLEAGPGSITEVLPDIADAATAVDDQPQLPSTIELAGRQLLVQEDAVLRAPGGRISADARREPTNPLGEYDAESRIRIHERATLDVSGTEATAPVTRNLVTVELRANELRDSPLQRDGVLRGQPVVIDARVGTPLADVAAALGSIPRTIAERTSAGGTISLASDGDVVVEQGATLDVSGGQIRYEPGIIQTTQLQAADGRVVDIGAAQPDVVYTGLISPTVRRRFDRWGVEETVAGPATGLFDPGYLEGRDGGVLSIAAPLLSLAGRLQGSTTVGELQRDPRAAPAGALLRIGVADGGGEAVPIPDYRSPSITLLDAVTPLAIDDESPLRGPRTAELAVDFLRDGGFERTELFSNGVIALRTREPLDLAPGTLLSLQGHRVEIDAGVRAPQGDLVFQSLFTRGIDGVTLPRPGVQVAPGTLFDLRGRWLNDALDVVNGASTRDLAPLFINGGTVRLATLALEPASIEIGTGSRFLLDGGGWRDAEGIVTGGAGGSFSLGAGPPTTFVSIGADVALSAFGVANARGGRFVLEAPRLRVRAGEGWAEGSVFDPRQRPPVGEPWSLAVGAGVFRDLGFSDVELVATGGRESGTEPAALSVDPDVVIQALADTRLPGDAAALAPTGSPIEDFAPPSTPFPSLQQPASVTLAVRPDPQFIDLQGVGSLQYRAGAILEAAAGSAVNFEGVGSLEIAGTILAPGGRFQALLQNRPPTLEGGFDPSLVVRVLPGARIDVSGTTLFDPNPLGLRTGRLIGGGSIELVANRGSVSAAEGALLVADGAAGTLDLVDPLDPGAGFLPTAVASDAGRIVLRAPESLQLAATLSARAASGIAGPARGGTLIAQLTRERGFSPSGLLSSYPTTPRVLRLTDDSVIRAALPNGSGLLDVRRLAGSGIDALVLEAGDRIQFEPGADLALGRSLVLDAPRIELLDGANVLLTAPYFAMGRSLLTPASIAAQPGTGSLTVRASLLDLIGTSTFFGARRVALESAGDLRLRGAEVSGSNLGALTVAGDIALGARRLFPVSTARFEIRASGGDSGTLSLDSTGPSAGVPFSVSGQVLMSALDIRQGGALYAPFGSIALNATNSVIFAPGSVTSVSAEGQTLPFGRVNVGQWEYLVAGQLVPQNRVPDRRIEVTAAEVELATGATVDLRGGGDLYAYEWAPGTGGTRDLLAATTPNLFAVIPTERGATGIYDPQESARSSLQPGDTVQLAGSPLLPEGLYTLLPARYALLPGAILLEARPEYAFLEPGVATALPDGTPVVAARRTSLGTGIGDAQFTGFAVRPGAFGRQLAAYDDFRASSFFPARALRLDLGDVPVPADAGSVGFDVRRRLTTGGALLSAAATGGTRAFVDVSATDLLVATSAAGAPPGTVFLDARTLADWNAGSLLIGGLRNPAGDQLRVTARSLRIGDGVSLTQDEVLLAARESLQVAAGARIATRATASTLGAATVPSAVTVVGAGAAGAAVLGLSDLRRLELVREAGALPPVPGVLLLDAGSRLATRSSLLLGAPGGGLPASTIEAPGAFWSLSAGRIALADLPRPGELVLDTGFVDSANAALGLSLASATTIDFHRNAAIGLDAVARGLREVSIRAGGLRAMAPGLEVSLAGAERLNLAGAAPASALVASGSGRLALQAPVVTLGAGTLQLRGFDDVTATAASAIVGSGIGRYEIPGALMLRTPVITARAGAETSLVGATTVRIEQPAAGSGDAGLPVEAGSGAALAIEAGEVAIAGTQLRLPSGAISLASSGSLRLTDAAKLDVAGSRVQIGPRELASEGGSVLLQAGGELLADASTSVDVSGAGQEEAGRLAVRSGGALRLESGLQGRGGSGRRGAGFSARAGSLPGFTALNRNLEAGGFTAAREITVGSGDVLLQAGERISAESVRLSAEAGRVEVAGRILAEGSDARATVGLYGTSGVTLASTGQVDAIGVGPDSRGGQVTVATSTGPVTLASGSRITTGGGADGGSLLLRAPVTGSDVAIARLDAGLDDVGAITIEPFRNIAAGAVLGETEVASALLQAEDFRAANGSAVLSRLDPSGELPLTLVPGLQFSRTGDLAISALDLTALRAGSPAANLTFRATGSMALNGTLSDGFTLTDLDDGSTLFELLDAPSGSLRFAAGAVPGSADPLDTVGSSADFRLGRDVLLRTATGDIAIAASRDIVFGANSSLYTAGFQGLATEYNEDGGPTFMFPDRGGRIDLIAGRDVIGSSTTQAVGDWQPRSGRLETPGSEGFLTRWGVDIAPFAWNAGSLGGGDVRVRAGRDLLNFSVAAADSAAQQDATLLQQFGGGVLDLQATRNISSLFAHATRGVNRIRAGGALGRSRPFGTALPLGNLFSIQDASVLLRARNGLALESAFNPTLIAQPGTSPRFQSFFFTYDEDSRLDALAAAGDVSFQYGSSRLVPFMGGQQVSANSVFALSLLPASLRLQALSGDILLGGSATLFASDRGQLDLAAARDISGAAGAAISMSDASATALPGPLSPSGTVTSALTESLRRAASLRRVGDTVPTTITAGRDISLGVFSSAKPAQVSAGRDLIDTTVVAQNFSAGDATTVSAGRDVGYTVRAVTGRVEVGGPGSVTVTAGRDVDLGFSQGVTSIGDLVNAELPSGGANVNVLAGLARAPDVPGFVARVIAPSADNRARLVQFVAARGTGPAPSFEAARSEFLALPQALQLPLLSEVFFNELVQSGREVNRDPTLGFDRGYAAIDALFPGSRPPQGSTARNPFDGDVRLAFSRIYSLGGGNISVFAPGGLMNVGLANPPATLPVTRSPSDLGLVAQREGDVRVFTEDDVLVNQSRIFTLGGGDIAVWSTLGDIDAGRGSKSAISAPPPRIVIDTQGNVRVDLGAAVAGSGIRTIVTSDEVRPGDVDLIAPFGIVNAGDAGIGSAGNLNVAAQQVVGLDNIQVGGSSTGVPAEVSNLGAALSGAAASSASATNTSTTSVADTRSQQAAPAPLADSALGFLDVFIEGFGEEVCKPADEECLRRNRERPVP